MAQPRRQGSQTYVGSAFWEDGCDQPGLRLGTVELTLADELSQIPIFRCDAQGNRDWRGDLYARLYQEPEAAGA